VRSSAGAMGGGAGAVKVSLPRALSTAEDGLREAVRRRLILAATALYSNNMVSRGCFPCCPAQLLAQCSAPLPSRQHSALHMCRAQLTCACVLRPSHSLQQMVADLVPICLCALSPDFSFQGMFADLCSHLRPFAKRRGTAVGRLVYFMLQALALRAKGEASAFSEQALPTTPSS